MLTKIVCLNLFCFIRKKEKLHNLAVSSLQTRSAQVIQLRKKNFNFAECKLKIRRMNIKVSCILKTSHSTEMKNCTNEQMFSVASCLKQV